MDVTVSDYIVQRLGELGIGHVFGVPGDYVLGFISAFYKSPVKFIGTCNELNAGYAADGYARVKGAGAAVVTYNVGGLSILNAAGGAYAEKIPLIIISGAPPLSRHGMKSRLHHATGDYTSQLKIFSHVTVDSTALENPESAPEEIDRVLTSCVRESLPVCIEIPMDVAQSVCAAPKGSLCTPKAVTHSDPKSLADCVSAAAAMLNAARSPVILVGAEIGRQRLAPAVMEIVEKAEIPYASTICGKAALPEYHPQFAGMYHGAMGSAAAREQVESSDCVIALGVWMTDFETGMFSARLDENTLVSVNAEGARVAGKTFSGVTVRDFARELAKVAEPRSYISSHPKYPHEPLGEHTPVPGAPLKVKRFYDRLNRFLDDSMILMTDPGEAIFSAPNLSVHESGNFIAQPYYLSIGYSLAAALGVSLASPGKRPVVIQGDGAFQMTCQELSSLIRHNCPAVIFILNNRGYTIERMIHDGPYNDIQNWSYSRLPAVFGGENTISLTIKTEDDLEKALKIAGSVRDTLVFAELCLDPFDCSDTLRGLCGKLKARH